MGNRRTIAAVVAVALLVTVLGACGSSSKAAAKTQARTAAQANAARAKVAAAKRRLAAARLRVAAQRRALAAVVRSKQLEAKAAAKRVAAKRAAATSTTKPNVTTPASTPKPRVPKPPTPTTAPGPPPTRVTTVTTDAAAIQLAIDGVNAAFAKGVAAGIAASEFANYYVSAGIYSEGQCSAFEAARGLGVVSDRLVVHPGSVVPTPGWVDPVLHGVPKGRVYGLTMDDIQTQIQTKQTRTQSVTTHATVGPNGRAQLFFRCR
jgi:hypothetical protein